MRNNPATKQKFKYLGSDLCDLINLGLIIIANGPNKGIAMISIDIENRSLDINKDASP